MSSVSISSDSERAYQVNLSKPRRASLYVDQYTGEVKGKSERSGFFMFMFRMHRWLLDSMNPGNEGIFWGKMIVGVSTLLFVFVLISGSRHTPPQPYLIEKQMEDFILHFQKLKTQGVHPILIAAYLHDELVRIHPFIDGNGRTSRLLMNLYLLQNGYTIVNLKGNNEDKISYYKSLEASHVDNNPEAFQQLVAEAEKASLERYLSILGVDDTYTGQ